MGPYARESAYNFSLMERRQAVGGEPPPRVMVVEDDAVAREALCTLLREAGYEVSPAPDGAAALRTLEDVEPDLIVTDLAMPMLNGFEMIEALRQRGGGGEVPVIVISANDEVGQRVRGLDLGADDFLAKPLDIDELLARMRRHLARARERRRLTRESVSDALTGLLNRRGILDFLTDDLTQTADGAVVSVVMVDLDDFKHINDTYGHLVGDTALTTVARELELAVRSTDRVGRLGGDEFLIVMPGADEAAAEASVRRLEALSPLTVPVSESVVLALHFSLGYARALPGDSIRTLLERADHEMYTRKRRA